MRKYYKKLIFIFLTVCIFTSLSYIMSFASISHTSYDLSGKKVNITWTSSGSDSLYAIRAWYDSPNYSRQNKAFYATKIKKTSYSPVFGLEAGKSCKYQVVSYNADSSPNWSNATTNDLFIPKYPDVSAPASVSASFTHKAKATNDEKLGEIVQKDNSITVKWSVKDPSDFSRFEIIRISSDNKLKLIASISSKSKKKYSYSFFSIGGSFDYEVHGFVNLDDYNCIYIPSERDSAPKVAPDMLTDSKVKTNLWWTAVARNNIKLYKSPGKNAYTIIPKGSSRKATWNYSPKKFDFWDEPSYVQIYYKGNKPWVKWSQVNMQWHITHKDYAWSKKEKFVNSTCKGKSYTNYLIWINRYCQRTNVFKKNGKKWKLIKVFDCNTGNYYQPLKGGQYYIKSHVLKVEKEYRDERKYYFMYSTKFGGSGSFHTRCRWSETDSLRNSIKRHPTTKGCDRLYDAAAKYIYNLPVGTGVLIK